MQGFAPSGMDPWLTVWLIGLALLSLYFLIGAVLLRRRFRESLPVSCEFVRAWLAAHPLRRRVQARQTDRIAAPLTSSDVEPLSTPIPTSLSGGDDFDEPLPTPTSALPADDF